MSYEPVVEVEDFYTYLGRGVHASSPPRLDDDTDEESAGSSFIEPDTEMDDDDDEESQLFDAKVFEDSFRDAAPQRKGYVVSDQYEELLRRFKLKLKDVKRLEENVRFFKHKRRQACEERDDQVEQSKKLQKKVEDKDLEITRRKATIERLENEKRIIVESQVDSQRQETSEQFNRMVASMRERHEHDLNEKDERIMTLQRELADARCELNRIKYDHGIFDQDDEPVAGPSSGGSQWPRQGHGGGSQSSTRGSQSRTRSKQRGGSKLFTNVQPVIVEQPSDESAMEANQMDSTENPIIDLTSSPDPDLSDVDIEGLSDSAIQAPDAPLNVEESDEEEEAEQADKGDDDDSEEDGYQRRKKANVTQTETSEEEEEVPEQEPAVKRNCYRDPSRATSVKRIDPQVFLRR